MAGTSPLLGVECPHAVDKRAEKDQTKNCQHSSFFSGYILSRTHHELDCQFMVGVSLSLSLSPLLSFGGLWGEVSPTQCAFPTPAGSGSGNLELSSRWGFGPVDRRRTVLGGVI